MKKSYIFAELSFTCKNSEYTTNLPFLLAQESFIIEQLCPLKICLIIRMQMKYFIDTKDTTKLPRPYPNFAMIMAF
jgi:hypothetical protein